MIEGQLLPRWAPRVAQSSIRRLYETDAQGLYDEELLDEVGWGLYMRCQSFITAVAALHGRARCPACGQVVLHDRRPDTLLRCACGWECAWRSYHQSFQHKQLSGGEEVLALFQDFMAGWEANPHPRARMQLIDGLIHGFHWSLKSGPRRTTGVNLIAGSHPAVVEFLDSLTYGPASTPGTQAALAEWREKVNHAAAVWGDARLRRATEEHA